jgi:AraC-like DNA-binding protein
MLRRFRETVPNSKVWLTPDLALGFHQFEYNEGEYDGLSHTHPEYGIVMSLVGSVEVVYQKHRETLNPGEILVVNPGEVHRCRFGIDGPKSRGFTLIVRPAVLHSVLEAMALPYFGRNHPIRFLGKFNIPEAFDMTSRLLEEFREQRRGYSAMIEMMVRQILMYLLRAWPPDAVGVLQGNSCPQLPWLHMHRSTEYMNAHGKGEFRLSELCGHVGVSPSRFIPLFKNSSGLSPHSYYNSLIVFKAQRLLEVEHLSTKEAAYALGFRNVSHFCTLFHQVTGDTPQGKHQSLHAFTHLDPRW